MKAALHAVAFAVLAPEATPATVRLLDAQGTLMETGAKWGAALDPTQHSTAHSSRTTHGQVRGAHALWKERGKQGAC